MDKENSLGPVLVGDFVFDYFMGSVFKSLVVGIFTGDAMQTVKNALSVVYELGFL